MIENHCERAREWASADLDGQLSEIERALLRAHVARCAECAEHARELAAATVRLRFAALEQPDLSPFSPPRRTRVSLRAVQTFAAAATIAVAVGLGTTLGPEARQPAPTAPAPAVAPGPSRIVDVTDEKLSALGKTYLRPLPAPGATAQ